jgi:hypothetical protein
MSNLAILKEAASWVKSWQEHYDGRPDGARNLARKLRHTANEQRANWRSGRHARDHDEYAQAVELLEAAAVEAEKAVTDDDGQRT